MDDLIDYVGIDAKHSFEDIIMPVADAKKKYGDRVAILGGVDMNFITRATPDEVREYTRKVIKECAPGGGYALGCGNTVANYIPPENYLAMLDEGWKLGRYPRMIRLHGQPQKYFCVIYQGLLYYETHDLARNTSADNLALAACRNVLYMHLAYGFDNLNLQEDPRGE